MIAPYACPVCQNALAWIAQYNAWYCHSCQQHRQPIQAAPASAAGQATPPALAPLAPGATLWNQNFFRIRIKVLAIVPHCFIEDQVGLQIGYCRRQWFKLREDFRVYVNEQVAQELFRIQEMKRSKHLQRETWQQGRLVAHYTIVDSPSGQAVGHVRWRSLGWSSLSEWHMYSPTGQLLGLVQSNNIIPQRLIVTLQGQTVATIEPQFKIIGGEWIINAQWFPPSADRRILVSCAILIGMPRRGGEGGDTGPGGPG